MSADVAQAEAERRWPRATGELLTPRSWLDEGMASGFVIGAAWAASTLADAEGIARVLREHQPTTGMSVTMGVTCRCGYWNGEEVGGTNRPVGYQGLQWHQATAVAAYLAGDPRE